MIQICEEVIRVLDEDTNPEFTDSFTGEKWRLWGSEDLKNYRFEIIDDLNKRFIKHLVCIKEISSQGYYFVIDIDD